MVRIKSSLPFLNSVIQYNAWKILNFSNSLNMLFDQY